MKRMLCAVALVIAVPALADTTTEGQGLVQETQQARGFPFAKLTSGMMDMMRSAFSMCTGGRFGGGSSCVLGTGSFERIAPKAL